VLVGINCLQFQYFNALKKEGNRFIRNVCFHLPL